MTKMKSVKRALFSSLVSLVLSCSMLVGTTFAWFTDSVESATNQIVAGNLDVELYHADKGTNGADEKVTNTTKLFDDVSSKLWEPGATAWEEFTIANEGTLALKYQFSLNVTDATVVNGVPFTKMLRATVVEDDDFDYTRANIEAIAEDQWSDLASFTRPGNLAADTEETFGVIIRWAPTDHDNDFNMNNGKTGGPVSVKVGAKLVATQLSAEVDGNGPDYDKDAWADGMEVISGEDLQAAINNGVQNIVLADNIVLNDGPIVIPANTASVSTMSAKNTSNAFVLNLNGKTISAPNGYAFENEGNLVIDGNGTLTGLGIIRSKGGSVVINGGNFYASSQWQNAVYQHTLKAENTVVTINGGNFDATVNGQTNAMIGIAENAVVTINGGNFKNVAGDLSTFDPYLFNYEKNGKLVINDGTFYGGWRFNGTTATTDIYGGNFTVGFDGQSFNASSTHVATVYGGTFTAGAKLTGKLNDIIADDYKATENADGTYTVAFPQESLENLFKPETDTEEKPTEINVPAGNFKFPTSALEEGMTVYCDEGTVFEGTSKLNINGATVVGATFSNPNGAAADQTINGTFRNCVFDGYNGLRWCYAGDTVVFENCIFSGDVYGVHFDGGANEIIFKGCTFSGFNGLGGEIKNVTMEDCTFKGNGRSGYNGINMWGDIDMTNCTFVFDGSSTYEWIDLCAANKTATFTNCVVTDGVNTTDIKEVVSKREDNGTIIVDGVAVVHNAANLAFAVKNGATNLWLQAGEYDVKDCGGKTLTISGTEKAVLMVMNEGEDGCDGGFDSSNVTFNGISINTTKNNGNYKGYTRLAATFNNCNFFGAYTSHRVQTFNNCYFDFNNGYFWIWGAEKVTFDGCTFGGNSKAILAHGWASSEIVIKDCKFEATEKGYTGSGDNTAAVEVDPAGDNTYTITFEGTNTKTEAYSGWVRVKDGSTGHVVSGL